jgi:hypothetical protein
MENVLWMLAIAGGPIVLGCVLAYVLLHRRRLSRGEEAAREQATRELYQKPQE